MPPRKKPQANLGLATTGELLAEVEARLRTEAVGHARPSPSALDSHGLVIRIQERLAAGALAYRPTEPE